MERGAGEATHLDWVPADTRESKYWLCEESEGPRQLPERPGVWGSDAGKAIGLDQLPQGCVCASVSVDLSVHETSGKNRNHLLDILSV